MGGLGIGGFTSVQLYGIPHFHMKNYTVVGLTRGNILGNYWYPPKPKFDLKGYNRGML